MNKKRGLLFIVSAPSGTGKTTIAVKLRDCIKSINRSVSYTTRPMRENEKEGVDYHFIPYETFQQKIQNNEFIEWAGVHNNLYGTSVKETEETLDEGNDILLTIDVQGACQLRKKTDAGIYIFILPPSLPVLKERLIKRGTNTTEEIKSRLKEAENEIKRIEEFDYVVVNNVIEEVVAEVAAIITAERCRRINRNILATP